jgi:hypothetical protein
LTNKVKCGTIGIQGEGSQAPKPSEKKLKKVLDKPHKVWYNENVKREASYRIKKGCVLPQEGD